MLLATDSVMAGDDFQRRIEEIRRKFDAVWVYIIHFSPVFLLLENFL